MATTIAGSISSRSTRVRNQGAYFYVWMAGACALFAFGAFAPTYWMQLPSGTFVGTPLVHIHSALFSGWTLLLLSQTWLAANGRLQHHRAWGMAGIALASGMVVLGVAVAITSMNARVAAGYGDAARAFLIIPLSAVAMFGGFFAASIRYLHRPEIHKRLILLATFSLFPAAIARIAFLFRVGMGPGLRPGVGAPQPVASLLMLHLALELFIVAGMINDWRTRGRPHRIWLIGAAVMTVVFVLRAPIAATGGWQTFAQAAGHIAG